MKDDEKTTDPLVHELSGMRSQNAELKKSITEITSAEVAVEEARRRARLVQSNIRDITGRRRTEEALSENEELFRSYLEYAPDGVYMSDLEGNFLYGNLKCEEIIGHRREELIGKNFLDLNILPGKSLNKAAQLLQANIEGKCTGPDEIELTSKEGCIIPVEISTSVVQRMGQRIVLAFVRDITDRKRTEEALRESEEKYRWILDNMADVITLMDMNLRFTYVSPSVIHMRGYTAEEAIAQTFEQAMTPESLQISVKIFEEEMRLEASGTADPDRIRIVVVEQYRKDGSIVLMENHLSFMRDEAKKAVGIISVSHDITERKEAEDEIKKQTNAMEAAIDGISILNKDEEYTYLNQAHTRIYGYENAGELIGKSWRTLYDADEIERFDAEIMPKFGQTGYWQGEALGMKKDGSKFPQEISITALDGGGLICVVRDITARKQAEEDLRKTEETYRLVVDNMADVITVLDLNLRFTYVSPSVIRLRGYTAEEVMAQTLEQIMTPESLQLAAEVFEKDLKLEASGTADPGRTRILELAEYKKDGSIVWLENHLSILRDKEKKFVGIIALSYDITDRKLAEEELRLSEERFRRIFDEGHFGMILANPDYTIVMANQAFCGLLGYSEQELAGQSIADITCEEDREKGIKFSGQLFAGSIPVLRLEKRYIRKDGGIVWAHITASAIHGKEGSVLYSLVIIEDLTDSRKAAEEIRMLHYYDSLTGLPNRVFHKELIKRSIAHAQRHKEIFALIYIGLDNLQRINDTLGHDIGDILLKAVADRLTHSLRKSDYVARSDEGETVSIVSRAGGDEFIVLAHDLNQAQDAAITARRLLGEISASYDLSGREVFMTASIGIALYPDDGTDVDDLLKNAEKAMRHTKSEGKNNYHFYSGSMNAFVLELLTMESDLHKALERDELVLYYQPKVDAATRMVKGMEALIRWKHPDKGLIPPMQFIPLAETSGLILPIGEFVIRTVCRQIKTWQEAGHKQMNIALNVSGRQFDQQNLIEIIKEALQDAMIPPQCLELEITESTIMRNPEKAIRILTELNALGIGIAIDDFGTGYSSMSYLKRLPLDFLKIDQSFIKGLVSDPKDQAIVKTTISMAHSLNMKTIAEGVETEEQLSFLQEHGCDEIQGYLFSRPLPAEEIPGILLKGYL